MPAKTILQADDIHRALTRVAHEILESHRGPHSLILLGIPTRGVLLAHRLGDILNALSPDSDIHVGALDVTMYRDDLYSQPTRPSESTSIPTDIDGKTVVLVDDVLYSGRTVRAALDALTDIGRPHIVRLAVLVDRGHRELPIRADFVGKNLPSAQGERVNVNLHELDGIDSVDIEEAL
jgi:pyrimidine operon attenuation protein/uracil phosphoribosyltransferase